MKHLTPFETDAQFGWQENFSLLNSKLCQCLCFIGEIESKCKNDANFTITYIFSEMWGFKWQNTQWLSTNGNVAQNWQKKPNTHQPNAKRICSNSRLSEFRINLFIDNFSSFHLCNSISSHFVVVVVALALVCRFLFTVTIIIIISLPPCLYKRLHFQLHFSSLPIVFALVLILEWIFINRLEYYPHYVFRLQISVL